MKVICSVGWEHVPAQFSSLYNHRRVWVHPEDCLYPTPCHEGWIKMIHTPSTRPRCSKPHPAQPWAPPEMQQPQLPQAACARASPEVQKDDSQGSVFFPPASSQDLPQLSHFLWGRIHHACLHAEICQQWGTYRSHFSTHRASQQEITNIHTYFWEGNLSDKVISNVL